MLFAWDMGANWGHVMPLLALQSALEQHRFEIFAAVNSVRDYGARLAAAGVTVLQSPVTEPKPGKALKPVSLAHIFTNRGCANASDLLGMVEGWRSLIRLTGAKLLLVDGAPPALMAARTLGVPVLNMSLPLHVPPAGQTLKLFPEDIIGKGASPAQSLEAALDGAMATIFHHYGVPTPARFVDLFAVEESGLFCWPELDPYGVRPGQHYWGPLIADASGTTFIWPLGTGPRTFAYLRPDHALTRTLLGVLARLGWPVVAACPGWGAMSQTDRQRFSSPTMQVHEGPLDIQQAMAECDFAVGNGGMGFTHAMLSAGKPLALLPTDGEKTFTTQRVVQAGAGVSLDGCHEGMDMEHRLRQFARDDIARAAAQRLALKYGGADGARLAQAVAQRCLALLH